MKNGPFFFLGLVAALGISWGGVVIASHQQLGKLTPYYDDSESAAFPARPTGTAARGQLVYADLGCAACHTQQVRRPDFGSDMARGWGERQSVARDYIFQSRPQLGNSRLGPDLANLAGRKPSAPDAEDLLKFLYSGSGSHPRYRFLFEEGEIVGERSRHALRFTGKAALPAGRQVVATERAQSLVAYLLSLNTSYAYPEARPVPAEVKRGVHSAEPKKEAKKMSTPSSPDPRIDQAAVTDESLLAGHDKLLGRQPDEKAKYRLLPLNLLFIFSGLIFFAGTYLNRYAGMFSATSFDEDAPHVAAGQAAPAVAINPVDLGRKLYNNAACNTCHQANGLGTPGAIPPLVASEWVTGSEERLIRIVPHGLQGPITVKGTAYNSAMPAFGKVAGSGYNWSDDKVAAVLTYIRQEWGNQAGPVTAEKVAAVRTKEGDHKPWTAAELEKLP